MNFDELELKREAFVLKSLFDLANESVPHNLMTWNFWLLQLE